MNRREISKGFVLTAAIAALIGAVLSMGSLISFASTNPSNVVASLGIPAVCEISLNPTSLTLPSTAPGSFAATNNLITDTNNGNIGTYIYIYGNNWAWASNSFGVSNTVWNPSTNSVAIVGTQMTTSAANSLIAILATSSNNIYIGANVPNGQPAGTYTQQIAIVNTC